MATLGSPSPARRPGGGKLLRPGLRGRAALTDRWLDSQARSLEVRQRDLLTVSARQWQTGRWAAAVLARTLTCRGRRPKRLWGAAQRRNHLTSCSDRVFRHRTERRSTDGLFSKPVFWTFTVPRQLCRRPQHAGSGPRIRSRKIAGAEDRHLALPSAFQGHAQAQAKGSGPRSTPNVRQIRSRASQARYADEPALTHHGGRCRVS